MINIKAGDIKLFRMAAGRVVNGLGRLHFLNCNARDGADASTLVAADAVFGEEIKPIVAIFGEGGFFVRVGKSDASMRILGRGPEDGRGSPPKSP